MRRRKLQNGLPSLLSSKTSSIGCHCQERLDEISTSFSVLRDCQARAKSKHASTPSLSWGAHQPAKAKVLLSNIYKIHFHWSACSDHWHLLLFVRPAWFAWTIPVVLFGCFRMPSSPEPSSGSIARRVSVSSFPTTAQRISLSIKQPCMLKDSVR